MMKSVHIVCGVFFLFVFVGELWALANGFPKREVLNDRPIIGKKNFE